MSAQASIDGMTSAQHSATNTLLPKPAQPTLPVPLGGRVRLHRSQVVVAAILVWALYGLTSSVIIQPGCPYDEVQYRCSGDTQGGVITMTPCADTEPGVWSGLAHPQQVGFATNQPVVSECLESGCSANQCLKTSTTCPGSGEGDVDPDVSVTQCVAAESTVDIQPLQAVLYSLMVAAAMFLLATRKPVDLNSSRIIGALVILFAVCVARCRRLPAPCVCMLTLRLWVCLCSYNLTQDISLKASCDWGEATSGDCSVEVDFCSVPMQYSPFVSNPPIAAAGDNGCQLHACAAMECLVSTSACGTAAATYKCVPTSASSDAQPSVVACEALILVIGLVILRRNEAMGWRRIISLALILWGVHNIGQSIQFTQTCDYSSVSTCAACGAARPFALTPVSL